MYPRRRRPAFTLIELLTVMAIITLLIGILTPALSNARNRATTTAIRAQINAMEVGLEAFQNDEGMYVPSNAHFYASDPESPGTELTADWEVYGTNELQGAHLLLDALVGRDFLGYDPKAPPFGPGGSTAGTYDRWFAGNDRRQPYIPVDGVDVTSEKEPPTDAFGGNPSYDAETQPTIDGLLCRVFKDKFGWPILYYRASPIAKQNTPIITSTSNPYTNHGDGVYDGWDNRFFTDYTAPIPPDHKIKDADLPLAVPPWPTPYGETLDSRFAEFIRSLRASTYDTSTPPQILLPRPVKSDRFIILSAGKDGIYGTLDDVANFNVLSEER
ncbi:MAG: prepilin-type N-terminal cleavage/methylation domain-containing protein [Phycisphaerae bacterium]|nr:prepilin-type N-terminal cleavage/methylation domain-containing protein [Phycisphaerae bacterium]